MSAHLSSLQQQVDDLYNSLSNLRTQVDVQNHNNGSVGTGTPFNSGAQSSIHDVHAASGWGGSSYTGTRSAAPFAILDVIYDGVQLVMSAAPSAVFPPLVVYWSPSNVPKLPRLNRLTSGRRRRRRDHRDDRRRHRRHRDDDHGHHHRRRRRHRRLRHAGEQR